MVIKHFPGGRHRVTPKLVPLGPLLTTPLAIVILLGSPVEAAGEVATTIPVGSTSRTVGDRCPGDGTSPGLIASPIGPLWYDQYLPPWEAR